MGHPLDIPSDQSLAVSVGSYQLRSRSLSISTKTKLDPNLAHKHSIFQKSGNFEIQYGFVVYWGFDHAEFENDLRSLEFGQPHP